MKIEEFKKTELGKETYTLEERVEVLEKVITYQKKQIRKLFNIIQPIKQDKES